ncbi:hypothetical protein Lokhon_01225 [Limimaricola hongkongensis DSM 17492]|uniref:Uncharacterized protein n=1 Tax=Limimaricola hongkongensis DSM 17492 TaxID=1122180 RepID=A0A017HDI3_9RHOB|nr:hypothetical protein Lokhon_01225 [Limimaricola hongkongensis DSM 17492]
MGVSFAVLLFCFTLAALIADHYRAGALGGVGGRPAPKPRPLARVAARVVVLTGR